MTEAAKILVASSRVRTPSACIHGLSDTKATLWAPRQREDVVRASEARAAWQRCPFGGRSLSDGKENVWGGRSEVE